MTHIVYTASGDVRQQIPVRDPNGILVGWADTLFHRDGSVTAAVTLTGYSAESRAVVNDIKAGVVDSFSLKSFAVGGKS